MNRPLSVPRRLPAAAFYLLAGALLGPLGCAHHQARLQSEEEVERDRYEVRTVGDVTQVTNAEPIPAVGVGLVEGLDGTGGEAAPDGYRAAMEEQLRKQGVRNVKEIMTSRNFAVVAVTAQIPPGARKDDPLDVEVIVPPRGKATSLRGGYLRKCILYGYDYAKNLLPDYHGSANLLKGPPVAVAEGSVLVGFGDGDEAARQKQGRIWGGGRVRIDWPFKLALNPDQQYARVASQVADRINETLGGTLSTTPEGMIALARDNVAVLLRVPQQYRHNLPHFLRVVRLVPLRQGTSVAGAERRPYRQRLAEDLLDPTHTVTAALRLEALGQESIPFLKAGLENKHPLVRFCAAESLAYLGSPSCAEELARTVREQPLMRAFALTAMASLDEAVCRLKLRELLVAPVEDETRYGAFRALRALDETDRAVQGELLNDSFWLHRIAPNTPPLVHVSAQRRAEVVLFGQEPCLKPPFSFLAGEFAITASEDDQHCNVSRFPQGGGSPRRKRCSIKLEEVLRVMADLGATYPEVVELIRQADNCQCLSCRVRVDALPQATSVYDLVKMGKAQPGAANGDELLPAGQDLGATPTLYETDRRTKPALFDEPAPRKETTRTGRTVE
jgi:hypothetical protein